MKATMFRLRETWFSVLSMVIFGAVTLSIPVACAQTVANPCEVLAKTLTERGQVIATIQSFQKKKPTAEVACSTFTKLSSVSLTAIGSVERDGTWCHVPEDLASSLKAQQDQINTTKGNVCKAAAEQRKAQQNGGKPSAPGGPLGGTGDILGGPMKLPQGAL